MKKFFVGLLTILMIGLLITAPGFTYRVEAFSEDELEFISMMQDDLQLILDEKDVLALVYLTNSYSVRAEASVTSSEVTKVSSGQSVLIKGMMLDENYSTWLLVEFGKQDQVYTGYIERKYLACSDELFLEWENMYGLNMSLYTMTATEETGDGAETEVVYEDIELFPESYQESLTALKKAHPNWIFVKMDTGLDWNTVVSEELYGGRSLIPTSLGGQLTEGRYSSGWSYATREALEYYLDPRNSLTEDGIFQHELLSYNASYHAESVPAIQSFLDNTFMSGQVPGFVESYAYLFWACGKELNISPFHLASRVYQEQGREGTSPLISGTYAGYEGYYNYFNIGASGSTNKQVIESGLKYAKEANPAWDSPYNAIYYGAKILGSNYITKGQDTLYLQKFDVDGSHHGMYWHQYMQNICAPTSEAKGIRKLYNEVGSLDNFFVFKIPVYENMPENCVLPTESKRVILDVLDGYTDAVIYLDGIEYKAESRNGFYIAQAADFNASTAVMYRYDEKGIPRGMAVWRLTSDGKSYSASKVDEFTDLLTYHGFSIRITGKSGIRCKTGMPVSAKEALTGAGLAGYTLKESGTLIMKDDNRAEYPMIKDGEKVALGVSYGKDADGNVQDTVFETVDGRQRFAAVLVGLPANQYKTSFAFRGYAVLTKDGQDIIVYGPIMSRSIYQLAETMLNANAYAEGTTAYNFLKQLIADGDAAANAESSESNASDNQDTGEQEDSSTAEGEDGTQEGSSTMEDVGEAQEGSGTEETTEEQQNGSTEGAVTEGTTGEETNETTGGNETN